MKPSRVDALLLGAAVVVYAGLAITSLRQKSATFDETAHLGAGYSYWRFGDFRLNPEHPPLVKLLAAAPLLAMDVHAHADTGWNLHRQWLFGHRLLYEWNDPVRLLFWARLPIVALGAGLLVAVFLWARKRFGRGAAAAALVLATFSPDVLAHGRLVTTDLGVALFIFLGVIAFDAVLEELTWARLLWLGLAVGLAVSTKFSGLVLGPVLVLLAAAALVGPPLRIRLSGLAPRVVGRRAARAGWLTAVLVATAALALVVAWASYGFHARVSPDPEQETSLHWERLAPESPLPAELATLARESHLLPEAYLYGFLRFFKHSEGRRSFLMGRLSEDGFRSYFLVSFLIKTPLALLILLLLGGWTHGGGASPRARLIVWLPVLVYLLPTLSRGLDIGHRHLLPIYPFLFVAGGRAAAELGAGTRLRRALAALLLGWYAGAALFVHPDYLAYFNELVGGPRNGYRYLVDSSLDWGQDLPELKQWIERHGAAGLKLSYFGTADPRAYHVPVTLLPGHSLPPVAPGATAVRPGELVAVSATNLQGVYLDDRVLPLMRRLRALTPLDQVGHSILVYRADFSWSLGDP